MLSLLGCYFCVILDILTPKLQVAKTLGKPLRSFQPTIWELQVILVWMCGFKVIIYLNLKNKNQIVIECLKRTIHFKIGSFIVNSRASFKRKSALMSLKILYKETTLLQHRLPPPPPTLMITLWQPQPYHRILRQQW